MPTRVAGFVLERVYTPSYYKWVTCFYIPALLIPLCVELDRARTIPSLHRRVASIVRRDMRAGDAIYISSFDDCRFPAAVAQQVVMSTCCRIIGVTKEGLGLRKLPNDGWHCLLWRVLPLEP